MDPGKWVDNYADYLFNYAVVRLSDAELAEDVVQDTFLSALKGQKNFRGGSSERTWLISILKRKIIDIYRKNSSSRETMIFGEEISDANIFTQEEQFKGHWKEGKGPHSHSLLPEGEMENSELRAIIEKCISLLPQNLASVFIMKMIDEASSEEICKELDIT
ncbi:MAG: sigma-70 family RNA polymerase sigma factor, partial [Eudoraea sp.]|nr:sigma-70 family RNA polymerase sigma factor [Eudoraea sp.]